MENTLPKAQEISQGRGFCTPRPERLPEGNLEGRQIHTNTDVHKYRYTHILRANQVLLLRNKEDFL